MVMETDKVYEMLYRPKLVFSAEVLWESFFRALGNGDRTNPLYGLDMR